jgi:hypothetical protein
MPARVAAGLAAAPPGVGSPALDLDRPPGAGSAGSCCGGSVALPSDRHVQARIQRLLPITLLMSTAQVAVQQVGDDLLILRAGAKLRKSLQCDDTARQTIPPGCWEAHHIVAVGASRADESRAILRLPEVNIDINSIANGVAMRCDQHRRIHTNAYHDRVTAELAAVSPKNTSTIANKLAQIRAGILAGTFP